ncbi:hypothetical protein GCM10022403_071880 [Streptomyces coacervatus]|uniref:Uncharacterized protein n=1 Tax=Streptomyces coacervatus TaxID=647381 RepID=A0ABP7IVT2_9ACTN|nr:hypothetical protein [Streptomyces coacervatus]MDF2269689.1 hypothetical protein [Streptomyces coacervatus]
MHTDFLVVGSRDRRDERRTLVGNGIRSAPHSSDIDIAERVGIPAGRRTS